MTGATPPARDVRRAVRARRIPLSARPGTVAEARLATAGLLAGTTDRAAGDAVLLVSELVANAVRHTGAPGTLLLVRGRRLLRIEVSDSSPRPPWPRRPRRHRDTGGFGLFLVDSLAGRWGWYRQGPGKVVWCEVRLPPP
ncbi:ATP-binding protein [Kitasatospora sp. NPDC056327]|uniref:ATP-binding protein n=1 Tax=Kitasatospora sp. NPDC056327 TaxID=3345785 RepID=UPI0035DE4EDC